MGCTFFFISTFFSSFSAFFAFFSGAMLAAGALSVTGASAEGAVAERLSWRAAARAAAASILACASAQDKAVIDLSKNIRQSKADTSRTALRLTNSILGGFIQFLPFLLSCVPIGSTHSTADNQHQSVTAHRSRQVAGRTHFHRAKRFFSKM
jgi:hypothetical protein